LLALTGRVKEQVGTVLQQGDILAEPHRWDGPRAGKWRHDWGQDANHLRQTAAKLDELERRAQQVIDNIFKADSAPPGAVKSVDTKSVRDDSATENPVLSWISKMERVHAPWDLMAGDGSLGLLIRQGEKSTEALEALKKFGNDLFGGIEALAHEADHGDIPWSDVDAAWSEAASRFGGVKNIVQPWLDETQWLRTAQPWLEGVSRGSGVLGVIGDVGTFVEPEDKGVMGNVDRGMAVANAGGFAASLLSADAVGAVIPGVGEGLAVGTGIYLGGDWLYHNVTPFRDVCNAVGHGTVTVAKGVWHGISSGATSVAHFFGL
jgi:hypothetical protein